MPDGVVEMAEVAMTERLRSIFGKHLYYIWQSSLYG
jgi:hypothetical protein